MVLICAFGILGLFLQNLKQPLTTKNVLAIFLIRFMKTLKVLFFFSVCIISNTVLSQSYEEVYSVSDESVRLRIDQNKIEGISMLTGIHAHHKIGYAGFGVSMKNKLEELLMNEESILTYSINDENNFVEIKSTTLFSKTSFINLLSQFNATLTGYQVTYFVKD
jgi:hypothetical protein